MQQNNSEVINQIIKTNNEKDGEHELECKFCFIFYKLSGKVYLSGPCNFGNLYKKLSFTVPSRFQH